MVYNHRGNSGWDIYYLKLDTSGNMVIPPEKISTDLNDMTPHLAMDSLYYLHAVWEQQDAECLIYTKMDLSGNFIIPPIRVVITPPASHPVNVRIATDRNNRIHLVWMDQRIGSEDIYYKRGENYQSIGEVGIKRLIIPNLSCSPNPFSSFTRIPSYEKDDFALADITGRLVGKYKGAKIGENLSAGVYFIISQNTKLSPLHIVKIK